MTDFYSMFFGPLDKTSCNYFLILTVIFFVGLVILIANEILFILQNLNRLNMKMLTSSVIIMFNLFIAYFVNRLLYTMCSKTLN